MFKTLVETFRKVYEDHKLEDFEEELRKIDRKRAKLKERAMAVQKAYDKARGM